VNKLGLDFNQTLWAGIGAGSKGALAGLIEGVTKGDENGGNGKNMLAGIAPDVITGAVGFVLADRTKGNAQDFGMGVLISSIAGIVQGPIETMVGKFGKEDKPTENTDTVPDDASYALRRPMPTDNLDSYTVAKYGV